MSTAPVRTDSAGGLAHVPRRRGVAFVHGALLILAPIEIFTAILILTGVPVAAWVPVVVGVLLLVTAAVEVVIASRAYLRARWAGSSRKNAARSLVRESVPAPIARFARFELLLWESVGRVVARRPLVPRGGRGFSYHRHELPLLLAFACLGLLEIAVVHWLLPWPVARLIALVVGVMGVLWVLGLIASLTTRPHYVTDGTLAVRVDAHTMIRVARSTITTVAMRLNYIAEDGVQTAPSADGEGALVSIVRHGQTNVSVSLAHGATLDVPGHGVLSVDGLSFWVDGPDALQALLQEDPKCSTVSPER